MHDRPVSYQRISKIQLTYSRLSYWLQVYIQEDLSGIPYDLRLHKILEKDVSFAPSVNPSLQPSASQIPSLTPPTERPSTKLPTYSPTPPPSLSPNTSASAGSSVEGLAPTYSPSSFSTPTVGTEQTISPTYYIYPPTMALPQQQTPFPTDQPLETDEYTQLEYDVNPGGCDDMRKSGVRHF